MGKVSNGIRISERNGGRVLSVLGDLVQILTYAGSEALEENETELASPRAWRRGTCCQRRLSLSARASALRRRADGSNAGRRPIANAWSCGRTRTSRTAAGAGYRGGRR